MKNVRTPIQDALDAMERGEEVNLSVQFDDTVKMFQTIEDVDYMSCTFNDIQDTSGTRHTNKLITEKLKNFLDQDKKWSKFPIRSFSVPILVKVLKQIDKIEPSELDKAFFAKPKIVYEDFSFDITAYDDAIINEIKTNKWFDDKLISDIVYFSSPSKMTVDGEIVDVLNCYIGICVFDLNSPSSNTHVAESTELSDDYTIKYTIDFCEVELTRKTLITFDSNSALDWKFQYFNRTKELDKPDYDLVKLGNDINFYYARNNDILLQYCLISLDKRLDNTHTLNVYCIYLEPNWRNNSTEGKSFHKQLDIIMSKFINWYA